MPQTVTSEVCETRHLYRWVKPPTRAEVAKHLSSGVDELRTCGVRLIWFSGDIAHARVKNLRSTGLVKVQRTTLTSRLRPSKGRDIRRHSIVWSFQPCPLAESFWISVRLRTLFFRRSCQPTF